LTHSDNGLKGEIQDVFLNLSTLTKLIEGFAGKQGLKLFVGWAEGRSPTCDFD